MRRILLNGAVAAAAALLLTVASAAPALAQVSVNWNVPYSSGSVSVPSPPVYGGVVVQSGYYGGPVYSSVSSYPVVTSGYTTVRSVGPVYSQPVYSSGVVVSNYQPVVTTYRPVVTTSYYAPVPPPPPLPPRTVYYGGGVSVSAPYTRVIAGPNGVYVNSPGSSVIVGRPF